LTWQPTQSASPWLQRTNWEWSQVSDGGIETVVYNDHDEADEDVPATIAGTTSKRQVKIVIPIRPELKTLLDVAPRLGLNRPGFAGGWLA